MASGNPVPERAAKLQAYEEVLQSRTFARTEQLAHFLRYICDLELDGRGAEITEYSIATNALNRPSAYVPGEDSSVRSRAHALRRKLKEYYETEAPNADLRIELPKGSYRPHFYRLQEVPAAKPEAPARGWRVPFHWSVLAAVAVVAAGAAIGVREYRARPGDSIDPIIREAWGPVLQPGNDVLILTGAPPVVRAISSQPGQRPQGNILEPAPEWIAKWYKGLQLEDRGGPIYTFPTRGYTVFCDSLAAMMATSLLGAAGVSYHAAPESSVQPMAIHENALLLIGAPSYTTYMARMLKATPYSIWFDGAGNEEVLGRRADPKAQVYRARRDSQTSRYLTVYGLVTVLPSQPGRPRPERTILFSGFMGSPGAQGALEFFRSPAALRDLKQRFLQQGLAGFPAAYQVVVRCGVDHDVAINAVYQDHTVITTVPVIE